MAAAIIDAAPTSIEADDNYDSSLDSNCDSSSATTSVASSIFSFTYENGRRYHSDRFKTEYALPNDEAEQDRLDLYHHIFSLMINGKLHLAPLDCPQRVLDIGTGTGIWAIDFADENPQAEVIGCDISPIQPSWVPPNLCFVVEDVEQTWTWPKDYFDYIHIRSLSGSFLDWDAFLTRTFEHTAPGGWVEFQDYGCEVFLHDGTRIESPDCKYPIGRFFYWMNKAANASGRALTIARTVRHRFAAAGFVDVHETTRLWPLGEWPKDPHLKEIGKYGRIGAADSAEAFAIALLTRNLGWDVAKTQKLVKETREDLLDRKNGGKYYCHGWFVYGRKPREEEGPSGGASSSSSSEAS